MEIVPLRHWSTHCSFVWYMHFALRSGQEHQSLQVTQIELVEPSDASPYLIYTENFSKNNAGGISHRKVQPKRVVHHANIENPQRCLVHLYKKYLQHRPKVEEIALYLTPLKKPKDAVCRTQKHQLDTTLLPKPLLEYVRLVVLQDSRQTTHCV